MHTKNNINLLRLFQTCEHHRPGVWSHQGDDILVQAAQPQYRRRHGAMHGQGIQARPDCCLPRGVRGAQRVARQPGAYTPHIRVVGGGQGLGAVVDIWWTYGDRNFRYIAPLLWNTLPSHIRECDDQNLFKRQIKTLLFKNAYDC